MARTLIDTPIGPLTVVTSSVGVSRVWFGDLLEPDQDDSAESRAHLDATMRQLDEYFEGTRTRFDLALDRRGRRGFRGEVLAALEEVSFGQTLTYGQLAARVGRPRAARAVGTTMASNPIAIIVPCHRVVPSHGGIGRFGGGSEAKQWLLRREGALDR